MWFLGEYGDELLQPFFDSQRQQQLDAVAPDAILDLVEKVLSAPSLDAATKCSLLSRDTSRAGMALTALAKLSDRLDGCDARIAALLRPYESSCALQAQQRACEYQEMLGDAFLPLRETVLERMPPLSIDNAKARRAEAEAEASSDDEASSEEAGEGEEGEGEEKRSAAGRPGKAPSEPADIMDDLLGLDYAAAGPVLAPTAGSAAKSAAKSDDPFAGVMDMLNTMETAKPATDVAMDVASLFAPAPAETPATAAETPATETTEASPAGEEEESPMEDRSTVTVLEEDGIKVVLRLKKGSDPSETIIKAVVSNANASDAEEFAIQAAVPKYMKVQMKPISDPVVPGNNEDVSTQLIRVRNNAYGEVRAWRGDDPQKVTTMKLRITYELDGQPVKKICTVDEIPDEL